MKLRTAKKIMSHIGEVRDPHYTETQKHKALSRYQRTQTSKEADYFWDSLMRALGPLGRAKITATHNPGRAFDILMSYPESEWEGDPTALTYEEKI